MRTYRNKFHIWEFKAYYITDTYEAIEAVEKLSEFEGTKGLDIETAKLPAWVEHEQAGLCPLLSKIRLIQIYTGENEVYVFDLFKVDIAIFEEFLLNNKFCSHSSIFEIKHLTHAGFPEMEIGCSLLLSQLVHGAEYPSYELVKLPGETRDEDEIEDDQTGLAKYKKASHSLDAVVQRLFGVKVEKQEQLSDWGTPELTVSQINYAALDALLTLECAKALVPRLKKYKMEKIYKLQKDMQHVIAKIELTGMPVDWEYHAELVAKWKIESALALEKCKPYFGKINMRSTKQMNSWLKEYLKDDQKTLSLWPRTDRCKCNTNYGTLPCKCGASFTFNKSAIAAYRKLPAIAVLLEYKKYATLLSTFGESLAAQKHPITGRLHTSLTLGMTATGRLSSRRPNLQNMPRDKEFRNMFKALPGYVLVVSDFAQIETRIQAEFSRDPFMCGVFERGEDFYEQMASSVLGYNIAPLKFANEKLWKELRNAAGKVTGLGLSYGMGARKLGRYALGLGIDKPQSFWDAAYKGYYKSVSKYIDWCNAVRVRAEKLGYIETLYGKRRKIAVNERYTAPPNTCVQGTSSELMQDSMLECDKRIVTTKIEMVCTVHDELVLHAPVELADFAKECLEESMNFSMRKLFPRHKKRVADAAYGDRWGNVKAEL